MLTCKEVVRLLESGEELPIKRRIALLMHLFMCKHCARYSSQLKMLKQGLTVLFKSKTDVDPKVVKELEETVLETICKNKKKI